MVAQPRGCRYAMLGAIRRTGCSFVFRFVFKPPPPPPAPSFYPLGGGAASTSAPDSDNYCRFAAGNPSSRRQQLFLWRLVCELRARFLSFHPAAFCSPPRSPPSSHRRAFLAPPIIVGPSLVPPFLESESSIALDSIVPLLCIE